MLWKPLPEINGQNYKLGVSTRDVSRHLYWQPKATVISVDLLITVGSTSWYSLAHYTVRNICCNSLTSSPHSRQAAIDWRPRYTVSSICCNYPNDTLHSRHQMLPFSVWLATLSLWGEILHFPEKSTVLTIRSFADESSLGIQYVGTKHGMRTHKYLR